MASGLDLILRACGGLLLLAWAAGPTWTLLSLDPEPGRRSDDGEGARARDDVTADEFLVPLMLSVMLSLKLDPGAWTLATFLASVALFLIVWLMCTAKILERRRGALPSTVSLADESPWPEWLPRIAMAFSLLGIFVLLGAAWESLPLWTLSFVAAFYFGPVMWLVWRHRLWRV